MQKSPLVKEMCLSQVMVGYFCPIQSDRVDAADWTRDGSMLYKQGSPSKFRENSMHLKWWFSAVQRWEWVVSRVCCSWCQALPGYWQYWLQSVVPAFRGLNYCQVLALFVGIEGIPILGHSSGQLEASSEISTIVRRCVYWHSPLMVVAGSVMI